MMLDYYIGKLAQANYKIAIHPDGANIRLTSQADKILLISPDVIPNKHKKEFGRLVELLGRSYKEVEQLGKGLHPYKIHGIRNATAAKYIKLLIDIQETLELTKASRVD